MNTGRIQPIALEERDLEDGRMHSPSAERNRAVIFDALNPYLIEGAQVFEIASGTGQHAHLCVTQRRDISWQPSDPDAQSRSSIDSWARSTDGRMKPCLDVDVMEPDWSDGLGSFDTVFCSNMIHIAPFDAAIGSLKGGAALLREGGHFHFYGPFKEDDATAPSNLQFDQSLKSRDHRWGVRDLNEIISLAEQSGLELIARRDMPANNLFVSFRKI